MREAKNFLLKLLMRLKHCRQYRVSQRDAFHTERHDPYFPRLLLPCGQKLTLGLLATITLEAVPFHAYAPFPDPLPFF
jgi:hypothetical protein